MKAIIIAGGFGTRLRPLTHNTPKSLVPVANVPFVIHQINLLKKHGIREIILNLHYLSSNLKEVFADESRHGVKVHFSIEENPLGTAGAVKNAEKYFDDDPMIIFNGDILTDLDLSKLIDFHKRNKAVATLTLARVEDPTTYGLIITGNDGCVERFIEKPSWERVTTNTINAGIYVMDPRVFHDVPSGVEYSFERQVFPKLLEAGKLVYGYDAKAYWIDIGNPMRYMQAHRAILEKEVRVEIPGRETGERIWIGQRAQIDAASKIFGPSVIGDDCEIIEAKIDAFSVLGQGVKVGTRSTVGNSIIWEGTSVGCDVNLRDCILGKGCMVEDGVSISGAVVADGSRISRGSRFAIKF